MLKNFQCTNAINIIDLRLIYFSLHHDLITIYILFIYVYIYSELDLIRNHLTMKTGNKNKHVLTFTIFNIRRYVHTMNFCSHLNNKRCFVTEMLFPTREMSNLNTDWKMRFLSILFACSHCNFISNCWICRVIQLSLIRNYRF